MTAARALIAPAWHTVVLIAVFAGLTVLGFLLIHPAAPAHPTSAAPPRLIAIQIQAIVFEWTTLAWAWLGVRLRRGRLRDLIGGRWPNLQSVLRDLALGVVVWVLWTGLSRYGTRLLEPNHSPDLIPFPRDLIEGSLAVVVALSAAFCEEVVFRGYFQKQFRAMVGSAILALLLQAAVFGASHIYQGTRIAVLAGFYGLIFGVLALWRRSLRPGMIAHAISDIAARLLQI
ncbi:MAG: CPBP family intramembrane metalloprotease [Proteobacteria bacterium]|nr:CPBP family intramembrane metalloprotease [Pseudomonadota bacterium]